LDKLARKYEKFSNFTPKQRRQSPHYLAKNLK